MTDGLEAARVEVRGAIIRYPGAIPAGALVKLEKAVRANERARAAALAPLIAAMESARERFGDGSMGGSKMSRTEKFTVMGEEVGEVAELVTRSIRSSIGAPDKHGPFDPEALITELTQVAACAAMWAEYERAALAAYQGGGQQ